MRRLLVAGVLAAAVGAAVWWLWPSDARRVRARVDRAVAALSAAPGESDLDRVARLAGFARGLAPDVLVEAEPGGPAVRGREAVAAVAAQVAAVSGSFRVDLSDVDVTIDAAGSDAIVTALVRVTSASPGAASTYDGQVIRIELRKVGDEWLISRAAPEPALAR